VFDVPANNLVYYPQTLTTTQFFAKRNRSKHLHQNTQIKLSSCMNLTKTKNIILPDAQGNNSTYGLVRSKAHRHHKKMHNLTQYVITSVTSSWMHAYICSLHDVLKTATVYDSCNEINKFTTW
jgi:hypothetical protein